LLLGKDGPYVIACMKMHKTRDPAMRSQQRWMKVEIRVFLTDCRQFCWVEIVDLISSSLDMVELLTK
jgi:hypothetical protein